MSKLKTTRKKNLNVVYVFTKNNQVYVKTDSLKAINAISTTIKNEWQPIPFQWKSLTEHYHQTP
ncbi:hypothetical protein ABW636_11690 [Aquimarina sp. 2201CG1-2-11]|uniref:hypothetical protein n=1 Tax=Aquimarina discodermiae TaxID=3231043 RepID=UPI0034635B43